ncbi:MAG: ATP-dependent Clp protease ATP-binding subunit [Ruminococcus sp.]|nr:ATP-dependent Clp protease ATP-binding subunit [Ruminococcus sp.]
MDKFTKLLNEFTPQAKELIKKSIDIAQEKGYEYIGSEHLLLSFFEIENSVGTYLLKRQGVKKSDLTRYLDDFSDSGREIALSDKSFSQNARRIISGSVTLAKNLGLSKAGTEHILMMLLRLEGSAAMDALRSQDVSISSLYCDCANVGNGDLKSVTVKTKKYKALEKYSKELTDEKNVKTLDTCFERDEQMARISQILLRRNKNNPCLIGEAGVGKSAIVEGLAKRIYEKSAPSPLIGKRIFALDLSLILAGAKYRGDFEERLKECLAEASGDKNIILFIDEIHSIMGTGAAEGAIDAASILKPELARGSLQLIGATTYEEYRSCIEKDAALERRFQKVFVNEPDEAQTRLILNGIKPEYEKFHGVKILDSAITEAIRLSKRYITDRYFPDKAIDLIDEACSKLRLENSDTSDNNMYDAFNSYVSGEISRDKYLSLISDKTNTGTPALSAEHIRQHISESLGVPASRISKSEMGELCINDGKIKEKIFGQNDVVDALIKAIKRSRIDLDEGSGPIGAFVFMGRSGVGKTHLASLISEEIFGKGSLIRFDMSEFSQQHTISRLIGSPAGYVGYENAGELTEKVRKKPYCVLLFDEIEKAHKDIYNLLLQVLDTGFLSDSKGKRVSFKNTLIIMTTNLGAACQSSSVGFNQSDESKLERERMNKSVREFFSTELLNRIDECVYFKPLDRQSLYKIAEANLLALSNSCNSNGITLNLSSRVIPRIVEKASQRKSGEAREIIKIISNDIKPIVGDEIIKGGSSEIKLTVTGDEFKTVAVEKALKESAI